jgi:hypothetical protein
MRKVADPAAFGVHPSAINAPEDVRGEFVILITSSPAPFIAFIVTPNAERRIELAQP